ncbi:uncharacterized protein A1O9_03242 [Exophiala aquamarina CBS 119918]|uniref:DUF1868 domain-containing protein n=1 Tax=Exophiala aquamarina CBS 119918 TaxID=1182545 RepID=A0A072PNL5_9EURO|nr:uncharacterized protein A1O9_03242 [Exophiala aquamarina CBS 119918]KEF61674.1 hypothetical protein A1O9_03242 [Exophiala aquamarina CBS 119918]
MASIPTTTTFPNTATVQRPHYPIGIPTKFDPDGVAQRYPGNTTVCHIPVNSPLIDGLKTLYNKFESHPTLSDRILLLPPSSWHMTVLDGVRETECEPGMWPDGMPKPDLDDSTKDLACRLRQLGPRLRQDGLAPPYRMRVRSFDPATGGIALVVEGATADEEKRMRRLRDLLADTVGFKAPNHDQYLFHVTVAYLLRYIDGDDYEQLQRDFARLLPPLQQFEFELGAVEFCTFETMLAFPRLFYLGEDEDENGRVAQA